MKPTYDDIKQRIDLTQFVERYGYKLTPNNMIRCPWHNDKTESARVNKRTIHCFGCNKTYDVFHFIQNQEGISSKDAYARLAAECGYTLYSNPFRDESAKEYQRTLVETLHSEEGSDCLAHLTERGFTEKQVRGLGFGCVPAKIDDVLKDFYDNRKMFHSGYRLAIPLCDARGTITSYKYRHTSGKKPKYMHVKGYKKALAFFFSLSANQRKDTVLITEGELDAAMVATQGCDAVAIGGSHVTMEHVRSLKRLGYTWVGLCLDFDKREEQRRFVIENIYESGLFAVYVPPAKDPCEWVANGPDLLRYQIANLPNMFTNIRRKVSESMQHLELRY